LSVDEHTIELAGSPAFYRTAPAPGTPVLYVHGVPTSSDDWISFLERSGGIAPDLIGFGRSGKGGNLNYTIEGLTDFLERLLEHLGIDRVKLVVHDWGAAVGVAFAQRNPERIERVAVINGVPVFPAQDVRWHRLARLWGRPWIGELVMGATTRGALARTLRGSTVDPNAWTDARIASIWEQFDQGTQRAILRLYRSADERELARTGAALHRLEAPALIVWGEADPWLPVTVGETYAAVLPHSSIDRVKNAGHWPWLDSPEVVDRVASFLRDAA
jgi:pimeloyl-ACP methyl ester carboxylesterase